MCLQVCLLPKNSFLGDLGARRFYKEYRLSESSVKLQLGRNVFFFFWGGAKYDVKSGKQSYTLENVHVLSRK